MSDERDSADALGDGTEDDGRRDGTDAGRGAVVAPARPTGKRSRRVLEAPAEDEAGADVDGDGDSDDDKAAKATKAKTKAKAKGKDKGGSGGILAPFKFVWTYLGQVVAELRKVIWPNRKQMVTYTSVVLVFLAFMVTLIGLTDLGLAKLVLLVFGD
ncbi:preprotein translocase subunit SecE [Mycobacterium sp. ACS4331]|uniref:preprotein translocase subunit SecE n=1 Tax=Mycobacterium sp. ACS4331 TaxID=1834121 RepID=UPI0007FDD889|nr:preprotein translocase subunit SecE [Mycobacterium sp. ACS4331]OBF18474.1 preprotein translocase subunit SecE [Mycobacterium sp. ACS4331]